MNPPITEPLLLERLALDHDAFLAVYRDAADQVGRRRCSEADIERALSYPWQRPHHSFLLLGDRSYRELPADFSTRGRHPLLAIGSNGAPEHLATKLAHHVAQERVVPVVAGWLHDHDVAPAAFPTVYGAVPATPVRSPGTKVRSAIVWATPLQFTQLAWSEFSYRLERLDGHFAGDEGEQHDNPWAFVSRWGAIPGEALEAIPARGRTATPRSQRELLSRYGDPEEVVRAIFDDFAGFLRRAGTPAAPGMPSPPRPRP